MTSSSPPPPDEPRRVYALLVESLDDEHEVGVIRGAIAGAREAGATLLCVAGSTVDDPDPDRRARNLVFDLVPKTGADGVMVLSSAISTAQGLESLEPWLRRFASVPCCSVGAPIAGYPSVHVDNYSGMRGATEHLIQTHGVRRLAFIQGPAGSAESGARQAAFTAAMDGAERSVDPEWIVPGDFTKASGGKAVQVLLDERRATNLEAIVCANDFMALGAIEELTTRGLRVPEDVLIVGFDDIESARWSRPALTTARQPAFQQGLRGAQLLTEQLSRNSRIPAPSPAELLPTELVVRNSCGCTSVRAHGSIAPAASDERGVDASLVERRQLILAELVRASRGAFGAAGAGWESSLLDALAAELRGGNGEQLNRAILHLLRRMEKTGIDSGVLQEVLSALRRQALPSVDRDQAAGRRLEDTIHDARVFAGRYASEAEASRSRASATRFREFRRAFRERIFGSPNGLSRVLADYLPELGVEACLVAALDEPDEVGSTARTMFGFGANGQLAEADEFALPTLTAHPLLSQTGMTLMLLPIVLDGQAIGTAVMALRKLNAMLLDELTELFAVTVRVRRKTRVG